MLLVAVAGSVATAASVYSMWYDCGSPDLDPSAPEGAAAAGVLLETGTMFIAATTIMGFAGFGSVIAMHIQHKSRDLGGPHHAKLAVFFGIIITVAVQAVFMLSLIEGGSGDCARWWVAMTAVSLVAVCGFAAVSSTLNIRED